MRPGTLAVMVIALLAPAAPASAAELLRTNVGSASAVDRSCTERALTGGSGYAQRTVVMRSAGSARQVFVERGRRRSLDLRNDCKIRR
jgi:hypothetical protein